MDAVVIRLLDGMAKGKISVLRHIVQKNIHLSMRFFHIQLLYRRLIIFYNSIISIQILHALGLLHEHQRPDRDNYTTVDTTAASYYGLYNDVRKAGFLYLILKLKIWRFLTQK